MGLMKKIRNRLRLPELFSGERFSKQTRFQDDYRLLARSLTANLDFRSVIDFGCANAMLLADFHRSGKVVAGIELSPEAVPYLPPSIRNHVQIGDFSEFQGRADLACCVEMAEHIRPSRSEELVVKLAGAAERWIYFTAAPPGQPGHGHINCRPMDDWLSWFEQQGWVLDDVRTGRLRRDLASLKDAKWLLANSVIIAPVR